MTTAKQKYPYFALRIPSQTMDKLKYIAKCNGRSANKEIEQLILQHIQDWETQNGVIRLDSFEPHPESQG